MPHLHIVEVNDPQWRDYIAFRDVLRCDESVRQPYEKLKKSLAAKFPEDRGSYTEGKEVFIGDVLSKHRETIS